MQMWEDASYAVLASIRNERTFFMLKWGVMLTLWLQAAHTLTMLYVGPQPRGIVAEWQRILRGKFLTQEEGAHLDGHERLVVVTYPRIVEQWVQAFAASKWRPRSLHLVILGEAEDATHFHPFPLFVTSHALETGNGDTSYKLDRATRFAVCNVDHAGVVLFLNDVAMWYKSN